MSQQTAKVLGYDFVGPYSLNTLFKKVAGIYLITKSGGEIIDVGETENLNERIPDHERGDCWNDNDGINLWFHFKNNRDQRLTKEKFLRSHYNPVCGIN